MIGSLLYYAGGYKCPLFSIGIVYAIVVLFLKPFVKKSEGNDVYNDAS